MDFDVGRFQLKLIEIDWIWLEWVEFDWLWLALNADVVALEVSTKTSSLDISAVSVYHLLDSGFSFAFSKLLFFLKLQEFQSPLAANRRVDI